MIVLFEISTFTFDISSLFELVILLISACRIRQLIICSFYRRQGAFCLRKFWTDFNSGIPDLVGIENQTGNFLTANDNTLWRALYEWYWSAAAYAACI